MEIITGVSIAISQEKVASATRLIKWTEVPFDVKCVIGKLHTIIDCTCSTCSICMMHI